MLQTSFLNIERRKSLLPMANKHGAIPAKSSVDFADPKVLCAGLILLHKKIWSPTPFPVAV